MKAMLKVEETNDGLNVEVFGKGDKLLYILAGVINDIADATHTPVEYFTKEVVRATMAYKIAKEKAEAMPDEI